jgi:hypothetical protein
LTTDRAEVPAPVPLGRDGRLDVKVYYDAKGFMVSACRPGEWGDGFARRMSTKEAVDRGLLAQVYMGFDCTSIFRVVAGPPTPEEEEDWLCRTVCPLELEDGLLSISGHQPIEVPRGRHLVEITLHPPWALEAQCYEKEIAPQHPPWGSWFRQSRPGAEWPSWLAALVKDNPGLDPGHEAEWKTRRLKRARVPPIEVIVRLTLPEERLAPSAVNAQGMLQLTARLPKRCPIGLLPNRLVQLAEPA